MSKFSEKILVGISTSFRATHNWPEAGDIASKDVSFLEDQHRHTFHVEVEMEVDHEDRAVEFFVLQREVDNVIKDLYPSDGMVVVLGRRSCETIAKDLLAALRTSHPKSGEMKIKVSEDKEVWASLVSIMKD